MPMILILLGSQQAKPWRWPLLYLGSFIEMLFFKARERAHLYRDFLSNHEDLSSVFTHEKAEVGGICLYTQAWRQRQEFLGLTGRPD